MKKQEAMALALGAQAMTRVVKGVWHAIGYCRCKDFWGRWDRPCEIGAEELEREKAEKRYREWDAIGLGYVGSR